MKLLCLMKKKKREAQLPADNRCANCSIWLLSSYMEEIKYDLKLIVIIKDRERYGHLTHRDSCSPAALSQSYNIIRSEGDEQ